MTTASVTTGFQLLSTETEKLRSIARRGGMEPYEVMKGGHITLKFRGSPEKIPVDMLGQVFGFQLVAICQTSMVQTAMLKLTEEVERLDWGSPPHITLSHKKDAKSGRSKRVAKDFFEFGERPGDLIFDEDAVVIWARLGFLHDRHGWTFHLLPDAEMVPTPQHV